jgi:hypothetical protein
MESTAPSFPANFHGYEVLGQYETVSFLSYRLLINKAKLNTGSASFYSESPETRCRIPQCKKGQNMGNKTEHARYEVITA